MYGPRIVRFPAVAVAAITIGLLGGCGGDSGESPGGDLGGDGGALEVNNCTLVTNEEATALAGTDLVSSEDGPLGCAYTEPGELLGLFSIRSYRQGGDSAAAAAELAPSLQVIPMPGIGDDAVALADTDGSVNFLIARDGDLFVELVMTFLDVTPDSPSLDQAGQLASTALGRLVDAA